MERLAEKLIWGFLIFLIAALCGIIALKSLRCGGFRVQGDAQFFYELGAKQLDGSDHDGKACEGLLTPRTGTFYF